MSISIRRFVALLPVYPACGGPKENLQVSWLGESKLSSRCMQLFLFICLFVSFLANLVVKREGN